MGALPGVTAAAAAHALGGRPELSWLTGALAIASPTSRVAGHRTESERSGTHSAVRESSQGRVGGGQEAF